MNALEQSPFAVVQSRMLDVTHRIEDGKYIRTGIIPKGMLVVGTVHKAFNVFRITRGKLFVWDQLNGWRMLTAPYEEISQPGMRRVALAMEETEGCNILETNAATWEEAEREMFCPFTWPDFSHLLAQFVNEN